MASEPKSHLVQAPPALSGCQPSLRRKLGFWLLVGIISVLFVEVPAGSTMFPFFTVWGLLVVIPLYLLHSVFLAGLVFRFGRPRFWTLFAAGMLYGMYEAYITKVLWTSFRPEGPFVRVGGIAFFETIILVFCLHPMLAFVIPLFFTESCCTNSSEIAEGLPWHVQRALQEHPRRWVALLMAFLGFMQFVNSASVAASFLSGTGNCIVLGLALLWWRGSGGAAYSLRELLPGPKGLRAFGLVLVVWYAFWGVSIKPHSIPGILQGQLTIWSLYALLLLVFVFALRRSKREMKPAGDPSIGCPFHFSWRGFILAGALAVTVTTLSRLVLFPFAPLQILVMFSFYAMAGLLLFAGTLLYVAGKGTGCRGCHRVTSR